MLGYQGKRQLALELHSLGKAIQATHKHPSQMNSLINKGRSFTEPFSKTQDPNPLFFDIKPLLMQFHEIPYPWPWSAILDLID